eukprot:TRINITY_DN14699_c0_g1_i1.p1 TRINITY_DN14699_c0_g1~~TRINITY_DN14699_c0_g1_i1.p1  ORF type:complete len:430 (+),score=27.78 TRINITY_DN14699_c0_g1_i1:39-1292(+)
MEQWTPEDVVRWAFQQPGITPSTVQILRQSRIDGARLVAADDTTLAAVGLDRLGPRRAVMRARDRFAPPQAAATDVPSRAPAPTSAREACAVRDGLLLWQCSIDHRTCDRSDDSLVGRCESMCPESKLHTGQRSSQFEGQEYAQAVKAYERSAAGNTPDPNDIRTPAVLLETCRHLACNVLSQMPPPHGVGSVAIHQVYAFVANRLRAVRADFGVQGSHARGLWQVRCAEFAARFHAAAPMLLAGSEPCHYDDHMNSDMLDDILSHRLLPLYIDMAAEPTTRECGLLSSGEMAAMWVMHQVCKNRLATRVADEVSVVSGPSASAGAAALQWLHRLLPHASGHLWVKAVARVVGLLDACLWNECLKATGRLPWILRSVGTRLVAHVRTEHFLAVWKATRATERLRVSDLSKDLRCVPA